MITIHPKNIQFISIEKGECLGKVCIKKEKVFKNTFFIWNTYKYVDVEYVNGRIAVGGHKRGELFYKKDGKAYSYAQLTVFTNIKGGEYKECRFEIIELRYKSNEEALEEYNRLTKQFNDYNNLNPLIIKIKDID